MTDRFIYEVFDDDDHDSVIETYRRGRHQGSQMDNMADALADSLCAHVEGATTAPVIRALARAAASVRARPHRGRARPEGGRPLSSPIVCTRGWYGGPDPVTAVLVRDPVTGLKAYIAGTDSHVRARDWGTRLPNEIARAMFPAYAGQAWAPPH